MPHDDSNDDFPQHLAQLNDKVGVVANTGSTEVSIEAL